MNALDESSSKKLADTILKKAKELGASDAEVTLGFGSGFSLNVRKGATETLEHSKDKNVHVKVYFGYKTGSANTSDVKPESIQTMLEKACYIARFTEEDPFVGLADKDLMAYGYPDLDLYHPWPIEITQAIEMAKTCEAVGMTYSNKITNSEGVSVNSSTLFNTYANTNGFSGATHSTRHSISCGFIAEDNQEMQRDYYYSNAVDAKDLEDINDIATKAGKRSVDRLGAKKIATKKCPVIFAAEVAKELIGDFIGAIHGYALYQKASFLLDKLHTQVFPKHVNIIEDPFIPKALGSSPFDAEGVKLSKTNIIANGILERYILDSYSARKLKMKTTGNAGGVHNIVMSSADINFNELLKKMHTGLLVTEFMGDGVNIVTGDYSRGVFGYWVENGQIQYPVSGVTIAGNLQDMLLNIADISNDIDCRSSILTGSMLMDELTIAGH